MLHAVLQACCRAGVCVLHPAPAATGSLPPYAKRVRGVRHRMNSFAAADARAGQWTAISLGIHTCAGADYHSATSGYNSKGSNGTTCIKHIYSVASILWVS